MQGYEARKTLLTHAGLGHLVDDASVSVDRRWMQPENAGLYISQSQEGTYVAKCLFSEDTDFRTNCQALIRLAQGWEYPVGHVAHID